MASRRLRQVFPSTAYSSSSVRLYRNCQMKTIPCNTSWEIAQTMLPTRRKQLMQRFWLHCQTPCTLRLVAKNYKALHLMSSSLCSVMAFPAARRACHSCWGPGSHQMSSTVCNKPTLSSPQQGRALAWHLQSDQPLHLKLPPGVRSSSSRQTSPFHSMQQPSSRGCVHLQPSTRRPPPPHQRHPRQPAWPRLTPSSSRAPQTRFRPHSSS